MLNLFKLAIVLLLICFSSFSLAADKVRYKELSNEIVKSIVSGKLDDIDGLLKKLDELTNIGVEMAKETAIKHPDGKAMLEYLVNNIDKAKASSLDDVEHNWHHGHAFKNAKIEHDKFDHYGPIICAKDAVVHPITVYIALNEYKKSKNKELLSRAQAELEEVLGQIKYVD